MNTTETQVNPSNAFVLRLKAEIEAVNAKGRAVFIGITYTAKSTGETARHVLNLGVSYLNSVRKAIAELETLNRSEMSGLEIQALDEVLASYNNTLTNAEKGLSNDRYTKKDTYLDIVPGLKLNLNDGSFEISAFSVSKTVIVAGVHKTVNSRPLTIVKDKLKKGLAVEKFRTFCLDVGNLDSVRIGGDELEVL